MITESEVRDLLRQVAEEAGPDEIGGSLNPRYRDTSGKPVCVVGRVLAKLDMLDALADDENGELFLQLHGIRELFTPEAQDVLRRVQVVNDVNLTTPIRVNVSRVLAS